MTNFKILRPAPGTTIVLSGSLQNLKRWETLPWKINNVPQKELVKKKCEKLIFCRRPLERQLVE